MVQWLRLRAPTARGMGSIPGQGTKIPHPASCMPRARLEKNCEEMRGSGWVICWMMVAKCLRHLPSNTVCVRISVGFYIQRRF